MNDIFFSTLTLEQLREVLAETVKEQFHNIAQFKQPVEEYLTRNQVSRELHVSKVTLRQWEKQGILLPSRLGSRVRYTRSHINQSLNQKKFKTRAEIIKGKAV